MGQKKLLVYWRKNRNKEGWLITLDYPSYIPFVTYAENRALTKKTLYRLWKKGVSKQ